MATYGDTEDVYADAPSDSIHQGSEIEIDTTKLPENEVMPAGFNPCKAYAVDPYVSRDGLPTSS